MRALEHGEALPPMTPAVLDLWRAASGRRTYEATARASGITRQAIHNWHARGTHAAAERRNLGGPAGLARVPFAAR